MHTVRELNDIVGGVADGRLSRRAGREAIWRVIMRKVGPVKLYEPITDPTEMLIERDLPAGEFAEMLDVIEYKRGIGEVVRGGGYFNACLRNLYAKHNIPWRRLQQKTTETRRRRQA